VGVFAEGTTELMLALATPTPKGYWGVPVLVWGMPGTGKSTFIESLQRDGFPVYTMIASLHDPTDFNGLPVLHDGRMRFAPPDWVYLFEEHGQGILFLDELTTAPPTVQTALLRLVLERKVGAHSLPAGVRIVAAANPPDIAASGWELSPPLANRFVHLNWQLDGDTYRRALEEGFQQATLSANSTGSSSWRASCAATPLWRSPSPPRTSTPTPARAAGTSPSR
jgi:MoxR-like ATPase